MGKINETNISVLVNKDGLYNGVKNPPRRIMFLLKYKQKHYYLKFSPAKNFYTNGIENLNEFLTKLNKQKTQKNRYKLLDSLPLDGNIIGKYMYEALMYSRVENELKKANLQRNMVTLIDYGYINISQENVYVFIDKKMVKLSNNDTIKVNYIGSCKSNQYYSELESNYKEILKNTYLNTIFSYIITECTDSFNTYKKIISICSKNKIENYIYSTLKILVYLRKSLNFSHNDLHSNNLLIGKNGEVKIFDFDQSTCKNSKASISSKHENYFEKIVKLYGLVKQYNYSKKTPPKSVKELLYTLDLYRLIVEPFLERYINDMNGDPFPNIYLTENLNNSKYTSLYDIITNLFNKPLIFDMLNLNACINSNILDFFNFQHGTNYGNFCIKYFLAWWIFGNKKKILINHKSINLGNNYKSKKKTFKKTKHSKNNLYSKFNLY